MSRVEILTGLIIIGIVWAFLAYKIREARLSSVKAYKDRGEAFNDDENDISGDDGFDQEIVGESNYQENIKDVASLLPVGSRFVQATLCLEDDNEHDKNAVAVKIAGLTVGYLSRDAARAYRKLVKKNGIPSIAKCPAMIAGGDDGKYYGVWLGMNEID